MAKRSDLTAETVRELLDYDPETGVFTWKWRESKWFDGGPTGRAIEWAQRNWNSRRAGTRAFSCIASNGYAASALLGKRYSAHRLVWLHYYGEHPKGGIDHINHDRSDNRIANLQVVSQQENARNSSLSKGNTSGHTGVYWDSITFQWRAEIKVDDKSRKLGRYNILADAVEARKSAEQQYGFHANHGASHVY